MAFTSRKVQECQTMDELLKGRISILEPVVLSAEARNTREMFAGTRAQTLDLARKGFLQAPDVSQTAIKEG